jgi:hypothetical protein
MNRNYRFKSLEISQKNSKDEKAHNGVEQSDQGVFEIGETRSINFILDNGSQQNFPYTHYLTGWYGMDNDEWVIKLFFATHIVTIRGYCLEELYENIRLLKVKKVIAYDERYLDMVGESDPFVTDIVVKWKNDTTTEK